MRYNLIICQKIRGYQKNLRIPTGKKYLKLKYWVGEDPVGGLSCPPRPCPEALLAAIVNDVNLFKA